MFSTRRQQALLLLGLVSLTAALGWRLRLLWKEYQKRTAWIYAGPAKPAGPSGTAPGGAPATQSFSEIVARDLFRPERSGAPAAAAQAPEMPYLRGTMSLGSGWFALMAAGNQPAGPYKRVIPGEEIGGYKLTAISGSEVVLEWGDRKFTVDVAESVRRTPRSEERTSAVSAARPAGTTSAPQASAAVTTVAPVSPSASDARAAYEAEKKKFTPAGYNAPPGAPVNAPAGTVFGGKRKVVDRTPFGAREWWEDVQPAAPAKTPPGKEPEKKEP